MDDTDPLQHALSRHVLVHLEGLGTSMERLQVSGGRRSSRQWYNSHKAHQSAPERYKSWLIELGSLAILIAHEEQYKDSRRGDIFARQQGVLQHYRQHRTFTVNVCGLIAEGSHSQPRSIWYVSNIVQSASSRAARTTQFVSSTSKVGFRSNEQLIREQTECA